MQTSVSEASGLPASASAAASAGSKVNGGRSAGPIAPVTRAALTSAKVEIPSAVHCVDWGIGSGVKLILAFFGRKKFQVSRNANAD
jgi:hypothetical protein